MALLNQAQMVRHGVNYPVTGRVMKGTTLVWGEEQASWESVCLDLGATFVQIGTRDVVADVELSGTGVVETAGIDGMAGLTGDVAHPWPHGAYTIMSMVCLVSVSTTATNGRQAGLRETDLDANGRAQLIANYASGGLQGRLLFWGSGTPNLEPLTPSATLGYVMLAGTFTTAVGAVAWARDMVNNVWLTNSLARNRTFAAEVIHTDTLDLDRGEIAGLAMFPEYTLTEADLERLRATVPTIT